MMSILCCMDCRVGLEALGAIVSLEPMQITPGSSCQAHPSTFATQATAALLVEPDTLEAWRLNAPPAPVHDVSDWPTVAQMAAVLYNRESVGTDGYHQAVADARSLILAAKGQLP